MSFNHRLLGLATVLLCCGPVAAQPEHVRHERRLPGRVLACVTLPDINECFTRGKASLADATTDAWTPFLQGLSNDHNQISEQLRSQIGVSLPELKQLGLRQVTVAFVKLPDRPITLVTMIDFQSPHLMNLIVERFSRAMLSAGFTRTRRLFGRTCVSDFRRRIRFRQLSLCTHDSVFCLATNPEVLRDLLRSWNHEHRSQPEKPDCVEVMNGCRIASRDPLLTWYADPVGILQELIMEEERDDSEFRRFLLNLISRTGLDRVTGVAGSLDAACGNLALISQVQLVLQKSSENTAELPKPQAIDLRPPPWIAAEANCYYAGCWDLQAAFDGGNRLLSIIEGEDALDAYIQRIRTVTDGFDLRQDLLDKLTGRFYVAEIPQNGQQHPVVAVQVRSSDDVQGLLERITQHHLPFTSQKATSHQVGDLTVYEQPFRSRRIFITLLGDMLMFSDSQQVVSGLAQPPELALVNCPGYHQVAEFLSGNCLMQTYDRSHRSLSRPYQFLRSETTPDQTFGIDFSRLPEFADFAAMLGPSASSVVRNDRGLLYSHFHLYADNDRPRTLSADD
ncbi:MAG: hypothetical protein RIK87_11785 [Fuerstiella sp.]